MAGDIFRPKAHLHVSIRTSQAHSAFQGMTRLANIQRRLSLFAIRQALYDVRHQYCRLRLSNMVQGLSPTQEILKGLQNLALRKILGVSRPRLLSSWKRKQASHPLGSDPVTVSVNMLSAFLSLPQPTQSIKSLRGLSRKPLSAPLAPPNQNG